jgi:hypothetical protein
MEPTEVPWKDKMTKHDIIEQRNLVLRDLNQALMGLDETLPGTMKQVRAIISDRFKILLDKTPRHVSMTAQENGVDLARPGKSRGTGSFKPVSNAPSPASGMTRQVPGSPHPACTIP